MSELRQQGGPARGSFAAARQSVGVLFRGLVIVFALERQPQGRNAMRPMQDGVPAANAGLQDRLDAVYPGATADPARALGIIRRVAVGTWRVMTSLAS